MVAQSDNDTAQTDWLIAKAHIEERPFRSDVPVIGSLIARFRETWNRVATKWYVRPLLAQQNEFNQLIAEQIHDHNVRLIAQDRERTELVHDTAELTAQLIQMNRLLESIDERLSHLEAMTGE